MDDDPKLEAATPSAPTERQRRLERVRRTHLPYCNILEFLSYDQMVQEGCLEDFFDVLPQWMGDKVNADTVLITFCLPEGGMDDSYYDALTRLGRIIDENAAPDVDLRLMPSMGQAFQVCGHILRAGDKVKSLSLGRGGVHDHETPSIEFEQALRGLQNLKGLELHLPDTQEGSLGVALLGLPQLHFLSYRGCCPPTVLRQLVQKNSLQTLYLKHGVSAEEHFQAVVDGLGNRERPLDHLDLTLELNALSALKHLESVYSMLSNGKGKCVKITVEETCIFDLELYHDPSRPSKLSVQLCVQGKYIGGNWKEWLPSLCGARGVTSLVIMGFDGTPIKCEQVASIASEVELKCLEVDLTDEFNQSAGFLDLSSVKPTERIVLTNRRQQPTMMLEGELRFAFSSKLESLVLYDRWNRDCVRVSMEYAARVLASFRPGQSNLRRFEACLPDGYLDKPKHVRKDMQKQFLEHAWRLYHLEDLKLIAVKRFSGGSTSIGPSEFDDECGDQLECLLALNKAGRGYLNDPNASRWSGVKVLATVQDFIREDLCTEALFYHLLENPNLCNLRNG